MIDFTPEAKRRLEDYLSQVRRSLAGCKSVDAAEVEADIHEHVEHELQGAAAPVGLDELQGVLAKLGKPQQWAPQEDQPWWRKLVLRLRSGPEDWRLAYLVFGLLVLALLALAIAENSSPTYAYDVGTPDITVTPQFGDGNTRVYVSDSRSRPVMISRGHEDAWLCVFCALGVASFLLARAALTLVGDRGLLSAQRWLVYPTLLLVYVPLLAGLLAWQAGAGTYVAYEATGITRDVQYLSASINRLSNAPQDPQHWPESVRRIQELREQYRNAEYLMYVRLAAVGVISTALWFVAAGLVLRRWPGIARFMFRPFLERFTPRWAKWILLPGLVLAIVSLVGMLVCA